MANRNFRKAAHTLCCQLGINTAMTIRHYNRRHNMHGKQKDWEHFKQYAREIAKETYRLIGDEEE